MRLFQKWAILLAAGTALIARADTQYSTKVVDAKGQPVADATVDFYQSSAGPIVGLPNLEVKQHTKSDAQGMVSFSLPEGNTAGTFSVVVVKKAGLAPAWKFWNGAVGMPDSMTLMAPESLSGSVVDENGKPVADAEVSAFLAVIGGLNGNQGLVNFVFGKAARDCFSTRTSADGHFRIANLPADASVALTVVKAGKALRSVGGMDFNTLPYHSGQEDIKLALESGGSVEGKVVQSTGEPLSGVKLEIQPAGGVTGLSAPLSPAPIQSGADGSFVIPNLAVGAYSIVASFPGSPTPDWVAAPTDVTIASGQTVRNLTITASKGGVLEATVVSIGDRKPVTNAIVYAYNMQNQGAVQPISVSTSNSNVAHLRLAPGAFTVYALRGGMSQGQTTVTVQEGRTNRLQLEVTLPKMIKGIVLDSSGSPVAGTHLSVLPNYSGNNMQDKTGADGRFETEWQVPQWAGQQNMTFVLVAQNEERNLAAAHAVDEKTTNLELRLEPGMSVSVRVEDVNHKPISNATALIMLVQDNSSGQINSQTKASDDNGRIQFSALPMGQRYGVNVNAQHYGSGNVQMNQADPKATHVELPVMVLKLADKKLAGRVLLANGQPAVGANVYFYGDGQPNGNARTDAAGKFSFDAVCEGAVNVQANGGGGNGFVQANGGDTNVVIRFGINNMAVPMNAPQVTTTGKVFGPSGTPVAGATLRVLPTFGPINNGFVSEADGSYTVTWQMSPGGRRGAAAANAPKFNLVTRDVTHNWAAIQEVNDTETNNVDVHLQDALTITGTVHDTSDAPIAGAMVNLNVMIPTGNRGGYRGGMVDTQPVTTDGEGSFVIPALPQGQRLNFNVRANGYGSATRVVMPAETQTTNLQMAVFKLKPADREVAGQVLGADGKPISGAQVQVSGQGQPNSTTRADSSGRFTVKQVCAGPLNIMAYNPATVGPNGNIITGNAQANGGDTNVVVRLVANQQGGVAAATPYVRETPLKEQQWTKQAVLAWPAEHRKTMIILLITQMVAVVGTAGGIFWAIRKSGG